MNINGEDYFKKHFNSIHKPDGSKLFWIDDSKLNTNMNTKSNIHFYFHKGFMLGIDIDYIKNLNDNWLEITIGFTFFSIDINIKINKKYLTR